MITKNHPSAYAELFKKAKEALEKYGSNSYFKEAPMNNIDDYFACLAELARIENEYPQLIDPIFTILPTTEQTLNIDADKRTITIPDNFVKYGVGVQGDEIAEILYFSIDRYFDAMDLADMDILIQWRHEKSSPDIDGRFSATYKKSLTLQPGKIVFGWPITSDITEMPGNIQFSVRFYRRNENKLEYSFSTVPATIKIQTGQDFLINDNSLNLAINSNSQIYNNLRNSKKADIGYIIASPNFTGYFIYESEVDEEGVVTYNLEATNPAQGTYDLPHTFVTKAEINSTNKDEYISGAGLNYAWFKVGSEVPIEQESSHLYIEVPSNASYNSNEIYYEKVKITDPNTQQEIETYEPYYVSGGDNNPMDDGITLYTRYSKFTPEIAGTYYCKAINRYVIGAEKEIDSTTWVVPGAVEALFDYPIGKNVLLDAEDGVVLSITFTTERGNSTLQWYYNNLDNDFEKATPISDATDLTYTATAEGYYFVKVTNTNNEDSIYSTSDPIEANFDASVPEIIEYKINNTSKGNDDDIYAALVNSTLAIEINELTYSENVTFEWVNVNGDTETPVGSGDVLEATSAGRYKCNVKNTYKGRDKITSSKLFIVT